MDYYPAWFDYAAWVLAGCSVLCVFNMFSEPTGKRRGLLKFGFCSLTAMAIAFAATGGTLYNLRAPHLSARGEIFHTVIHTGKYSSTTFRLRIPSEEIDDLHFSSDIPQIEDGETADIRYQAGTQKVLSLTILDGRYNGFATDQSTGLTGAVASLVFAAGLAGYGVLDWLKDGTAPSPEAGTQAPLDGDVDTKSLLNLNQRD